MTRSSQKLNILLFKTKTGQRSFSYRIVNIWNNLPSEIKLSKCLNNFKRHLREQLMKDFLRCVTMSYPVANVSQFLIA